MKTTKLFCCVAAACFLLPPASILNAKENTGGKHEISVSYGVAPLADWASFASTIITLGTVYYGNGKYMGAINASYVYNINNIVALGATYSFSKSSEDLYLLYKYVGRQHNQYHTIMPTVKVNWLHRGIVTLYSRAAVGITFGNCDADYTNEENSKIKTTGDKTQVGFQCSPVGIELGRKVAFFAETGLGNMGSIIAGLRLKL